MALSLAADLDAIQVSATQRQPAWKVEIYDVRSTTDTINLVVRNNVLGDVAFATLTGPRDFTADVEVVQVQQRRSDYVNGGVIPTVVTLSLIDNRGLLDPLRLVGLDPASAAYAAELGRYLRKGNVVVLYEGDRRIDPSLWPRTFTGKIVGQPGRQFGRSNGARGDMVVRAVSREAGFNQYERTSSPISLGTTFLMAAQTIAEEDMFLDLAEIALSGWGAGIIAHEPVQFVEETPLAMIAKLMFADGFMPRFNGNGQLSQISSLVTGNPDRIYQDLDLFEAIDRPFSDVEQPNCVTVLGLDANLTRVTQPPQTLATANITTGYFVNGEEIEVYWADDHTLVAIDIEAIVIRSVNGGLSVLGGGETFTEIAKPGPGGGTIGIRVTIDTGFAPWLVVFLLTTYVALAAVPDEVAVVATIPVGRIAQAAALSSALFVMTKIGRGQYEFRGAVIEDVYAEIRERACVAGQTEDERNTITIENHLLNTAAACANAARDTLFLLQAQEVPREIRMIRDLRLEADDIFQIETGQRYLIDSLSYDLVRDPDRAERANLRAFEVTPGVTN